MNADSVQRSTTLQGVPLGYWPFAIQKAAQSHDRILVLATTEAHAADLQKSLSFLVPSHQCLYLPGYSCSPYEAVSGTAKIQAMRNLCLQSVHDGSTNKHIVMATIAGASLLCPPPAAIHVHSFEISRQKPRPQEAYLDSLVRCHYLRVDTVRDRGEFSVRGGLMDIFPIQSDVPFRVDFFDTDIESIYTFDPLTQRRGDRVEDFQVQSKEQSWNLSQQTEAFLKRFRDCFQEDTHNHATYKAVKEGKSPADIDFWVSLFFATPSHFFHIYKPSCLFSDADILNQYHQSFAHLEAAYKLHKQTNSQLCALAPEQIFLSPKLWGEQIQHIPEATYFSPLAIHKDTHPPAQSALKFWSERGTAMMPLSATEKIQQWAHLAAQTKHKLHICCQTKGEVVEILHTLHASGFDAHEVREWQADTQQQIGVYLWPSQSSVAFANHIILSSEDFFRKTPQQRKKSSELFIAEATSLSEGDIVVHEEHGVGQFTKLLTLQIDGAAHDCLCLVYDGGDKLYVPVENLDVLTRYGQAESMSLDKLGSAAWQQRKAKVKKDLLAMAEGLLTIAAERKRTAAEPLACDNPLYREFVQRFAFQPTPDQLSAFEDVETDLASGNLMDRLICGDVGFGKTEVALRAACLVASHGKQVAVVVPTTLLARQHMENFSARFASLGFSLAMLSRLTPPRDSKVIKSALAEGRVNIVIGTHGLLHESVQFDDLGLVIIDEEQHFGVKQKERLKGLKTGVHVLTLSATPIPRTLQMSLSGVKDLSIIATPPLQRLPVLTQVGAAEGSLIREALLREKNRQGLSFYVCPRIKDLEGVQKRLQTIVPELTTIIANGQMPVDDLETVMNDFYAGKADVLLATNIIESGLDVARANTMIIHRADLFGLAQLYQLRGRVGRGTLQGYAYLTIPTDVTISESAHKRLEVMQSLDSLGAGFQLASYDLDIRGAGNILGQEQSGHIREIGVELYQTMLQEAVAAVRKEDQKDTPNLDLKLNKSPQIHVGIPVFIPESYIPDLSVRLEFYKRSAQTDSEDALKELRIEMMDRFGAIPEEVNNLFEVLHMKHMCQNLNIESLVVGDRGMVIKFANQAAPQPEKLVALIHRKASTWKVRPDQSLAITQLWASPRDKLSGVKAMLAQLHHELLGQERFD